MSLKILFYLIPILAIIIIISIIILNSIIRAREVVLEAFSTMDIYLKKRWDLIPNLVATVKGYATHEKILLNDITNLRTQLQEYDSDYNIESKKVQLASALTPRITQLLAVAENYPELKADKNFAKLSEQLIQIEDEIVNARKYYNGAVRQYNTKIMIFPNYFIAKLFKYEPFAMFETDEESKSSKKVSL